MQVSIHTLIKYRKYLGKYSTRAPSSADFVLCVCVLYFVLSHVCSKWLVFVFLTPWTHPALRVLPPSVPGNSSSSSSNPLSYLYTYTHMYTSICMFECCGYCIERERERYNLYDTFSLSLGYVIGHDGMRYMCVCVYLQRELRDRLVSSTPVHTCSSLNCGR